MPGLLVKMGVLLTFLPGVALNYYPLNLPSPEYLGSQACATTPALSSSFFWLVELRFVNLVYLFKEPTYQLFLSLILCIVLLVSISLISTLVFIISVCCFWVWLVLIFLRAWGTSLVYLRSL
jgi:hypothetical protein